MCHYHRSMLADLILNNNVTLLSSLNVSGFTDLNNTTNINGSLYISGSNILQLLNTYGTNFQL